MVFQTLNKTDPVFEQASEPPSCPIHASTGWLKAQ